MSTALELTREGWKSYLEGARRRSAVPERGPSSESDRRDLWERIQRASRILKDRFGARRVVLFGSLAFSPEFRRTSDVDLAVEGLKKGDYWEAWGTVEEVIDDRSVDLIEIEMATESLRRAIDRYGVEV
jgi:predicted nucleotidyltransferase